MPSRLVLGTAQLGMAYGINNAVGKPSPAQARDIVAQAFRSGIKEFDTAQAYGNSEEILGNALADLGITNNVRLITKLDPSLDYGDPKILQAALKKSLQRLNIKRLFGLMLHREDLLGSWSRSLAQGLNSFVEMGWVEKIGVSVYSPSKAKEALEQDGIDFVQIPSSIIDRRFDQAGIFALARAQSKKVYVRSVFAQGLLLKDPNDLGKLAFARQTIVDVGALAQKSGLSIESLSLGYALCKWREAMIVFGAETGGQVARNAAGARKMLAEPTFLAADALFQQVDEKILNPSLW